MSSVTLEIAALKRQVKEVIGKVKALKIQLENREITLEQFKSKKEILENQLRAILEKISEYKEMGGVETKRDALIAEEANRLMYEFQTEFSTDYVSQPKVFISASLDDHFIFEIDFTNYPEKPKLTTPEMLQRLFTVAFDTKVSALNKWSPQNPPHITDVFYDVEHVLLSIFKSDMFEEPNLNQELIRKILQRRKFLESAEYELELRNTQNAIDLYQKIIELSYDLEDFESANKYSKILSELKRRIRPGIN
ncbi:MAG: hypothetical protein HWN65_22915 [Candidatus Helarchaeota archaeon]|nr:hypothetical protein [Candidatus Helarchaeota archaeon]